MVLASPDYTGETHTVSIGGRTVTIENQTPFLAEPEKRRRCQTITEGLFALFIRYQEEPEA